MLRRTRTTALRGLTVRVLGLLSIAVSGALGAGRISAPPPCGPETLTIRTDACVQLGLHLHATIELTGARLPIVGGQFFLAYNAQHLKVLTVRAGDPPLIEVREADTSTPGLIDYAVVADPFGAPPTTQDIVMARFTFEILPDASEPFIRFRESTPSTLLVNSLGAQVIPRTIDSDAVGIDLRALALLQSCYTGERVPALPQCVCLFDHDLDDDIDALDFKFAQALLTGPPVPACP
ncbi:MAG: cohesin domain-containing protein [Phycisphaerae bacterium]